MTCRCGRPGREFSFTAADGSRGSGFVCKICLSDDVLHASSPEQLIAQLKPAVAVLHATRDLEESTTYCGIEVACSGDTNTVLGSAVDNPEVIQAVTCEQCLLRLFMLGDSARIALERMGRKVEVIDAPEEPILS